MLRVQLLNDSLGPLVIDRNDPVGINELVQNIKRSADRKGIVYEIVLELEFIKEGRRYLMDAFETKGIDTEVRVNIYSYNPNTYKWVLYYSGSVNFNKYDVSEDRVVVNIDQSSMEREIQNLEDVDVDLETIVSSSGLGLPAQSVEEPVYHSKKIERSFEAQTLYADSNSELAATNSSVAEKIYAVYSLDKEIKNEIEEYFNYPYNLGFTAPEEDLKYMFRIKEDGIYIFNIEAYYRFRLSVTSGTRNFDLKWFLKYGEQGNLQTIQIGTTESYLGVGTGFYDYSGFKSLVNQSLNLKVGDVVYLYAEATFTGVALGSAFFIYSRDLPFKVTISASTTFDESTSKTILIHEAVDRCLSYITNKTGVLYSTLLGRTDLGYDVDGELSLVGFTNGKNLRGSDSKIITSLKDLLEFINAFTPIGYSVVDMDGEQRFIVEKLSYFYDKDTEVISLGSVYNVKKSLISKNFYNEIEFGYTAKLDIAQTNASDEFNTRRKFVVPVRNSRNKLQAACTKVRASGAEIEFQRRLIGSTKDSKLDDEIFAVCLVRDGGGFKTQSNEGYQSFANLFEPETGYNYYISPARCLQNWRQVLASSVIRSENKVLKFSSGDFNYTAGTRKDGEAAMLYEDGQVDLSTVEPLWDNFVYTLDDVRLTRDQLALVKMNPYGYISFIDKFGVRMKGYLSERGIEHDENKGTASIELLKVYEP